MTLTDIFFSPKLPSSPRRLRSGWRALLFVGLVTLPRWVIALVTVPAAAAPVAITVFPADLGAFIVYSFLVFWVFMISWGSVKVLEGLTAGALGYPFYQGWWQDCLKGFLLGALMIVGAVILQWLVGGTKLALHPGWWKGAGLQWGSLAAVLGKMTYLLAFLGLAAAFEELLFRGYAFQTLMRGMPAVIPLLILSIIFGLAHWNNPSRTLVSTVNTILAGVWLAVGLLKTRSLWFATALHLGWNWMMGVFFGLPVSGMRINDSLLYATSTEPLWLTGGNYGCEGGLSATIVFVLGTIWLWQTDNVQISAQLQQLWQPLPHEPADKLQLNLAASGPESAEKERL